MEPARAGLLAAIEGMTFSDSRVPIIANCTGAPITSADEIKRELLAQVCGTVQWKDTIDYMVGSGVSDFLEIGPGRALAGMVKRIDRRAKIANVADLDSIIDLRRN